MSIYTVKMYIIDNTYLTCATYLAEVQTAILWVVATGMIRKTLPEGFVGCTYSFFVGLVYLPLSTLTKQERYSNVHTGIQVIAAYYIHPRVYHYTILCIVVSLLLLYTL